MIAGLVTVAPPPAFAAPAADGAPPLVNGDFEGGAYRSSVSSWVADGWDRGR